MGTPPGEAKCPGMGPSVVSRRLGGEGGGGEGVRGRGGGGGGEGGRGVTVRNGSFFSALTPQSGGGRERGRRGRRRGGMIFGYIE